MLSGWVVPQRHAKRMARGCASRRRRLRGGRNTVCMATRPDGPWRNSRGRALGRALQVAPTLQAPAAAAASGCFRPAALQAPSPLRRTSHHDAKEDQAGAESHEPQRGVAYGAGRPSGDLCVPHCSGVTCQQLLMTSEIAEGRGQARGRPAAGRRCRATVSGRC